MIFWSSFNWVVKEPCKINIERIDYSKYFCFEQVCNKYIFISLCCEFIREKNKVLEMCEPCNIVNDKWKDTLVMTYNTQEYLCIFFL
jgi:hypothetical protein